MFNIYIGIYKLHITLHQKKCVIAQLYFLNDNFVI